MKTHTALFALVLALADVTFARELPSKISSEIRAYRTGSSLGILYGWRYAHYRSEYFSAGGAGFTGQLNGTDQGTFSYGGLTAAISKTFKKTGSIEFSVLAGGGGGTLGTATAGGITIEPNFSATFILGDTVHAGLNAGYVWLPSSATFTGFSVGIRFEFITDPDADRSRAEKRREKDDEQPTSQPAVVN